MLATQNRTRSRPLREVLRALVIALIAAMVGTVFALSTSATQAEPRISRMDQTIGTHFPYNSGVFQHWYGDRQVGSRGPFYPAPLKSYRINEAPVVIMGVPPLPSRHRHVTGADRSGSSYSFDVDGWYGFEALEADADAGSEEAGGDAEIDK